MRIEVDADLCQGHAACEMEAPEVFVVPKHGTVQILDPDPPQSLRASVENAVKFCPTRALRMTESEGDQ